MVTKHSTLFRLAALQREPDQLRTVVEVEEGPYAGHKALHTCTSWYAYAAMFGSSSIIGLSLCYILCSVFVFLTAGPCFVDHSAV